MTGSGCLKSDQTFRARRKSGGRVISPRHTQTRAGAPRPYDSHRNGNLADSKKQVARLGAASTGLIEAGKGQLLAHMAPNGLDHFLRCEVRSVDGNRIRRLHER